MGFVQPHIWPWLPKAVGFSDDYGLDILGFNFAFWDVSCPWPLIGRTAAEGDPVVLSA